MTNAEQVDVVKKALDLTREIADKQDEIRKLQYQQFREEPKAPKPPIAKKIAYPPIETSIKFNWIAALVPCIIFIPWILIYALCIYLPQKHNEEEQIRNSPEYQAKCKAVNEQNDAEQKRLDAEYQLEYDKFKEEILDPYNKELEEWTTNRNNELDRLKSEKADLDSQLEIHYSSTKIIPLQYHDINALGYFYDLMSTSEYSIKEAIDMYDKHVQRCIDEDNLRAQEHANRLAQEQNALAIEQNNLLDEQNAIADRARRDAAVSSVVSAVQRHNISKSLRK